AKREYQASNETFTSTTWINFIAVGLGLVLALGLAWAIVKSITVSIAEMIVVMNRLANADTSVEVTGRDRRDEIGDMAKAVEVFKLNAIERHRLEAEEKASLARREARQRKLENLTSDFDGTVMAVLGGVSAAARKMNEMSRSMTAIAEETQRQGAAVSAATEQASTNVSTIASASNELSASIHEIASQVNRSATIAANAVTEVDATTRKMESLSNGANRIGEVVKLINDIASQTNLLALNATIEAARAGDAGKGFAVVANEVKTLANQTAKATGEIAGQIQGIQDETHGVVEAIQRITSVINEINEMSAAIASAIEEQGAAMQEVVRNVEEVSMGTREVASNIAQVVEAAGHTGNMAGQVETAAGLLTGESDKLRGSVEQFLGGVKAA
ncbi:MAG TPA: methyl-accepting chemotaxis protein, partial [Patescibacteria group bacterium]|nr:methyl-accepting chemotaxis protein [Patescibacteria group bacterium]